MRRSIFCCGAICISLMLVFAIIPAVSADATMADYTVMVYMIGSELETTDGLASADLMEMAASGVDTARVNVVAMTGGASRWALDIPADMTCTLHLTANGWQIADKQPLTNMGDADTLAGFIMDTYLQYPAEQYALILWDHAGGPLVGYGRDELHENAGMSLPALASALAKTPFDSGMPLAWIGFDTCLMGAVETAAALAPYADYLIASQEYLPGYGWDYSFLQALPGETAGDAIGKRIINGVFEHQANQPVTGWQAPTLSLSCIDLRAMPSVAHAMEQYFIRLSDLLSAESFSEIARSRQSAKEVARFSTGYAYDLVDFHALLDQFAHLLPEETYALQAALDSAIAYRRSSTPEYGGLSLYWPCYNKAMYRAAWSTQYAEIAPTPAYLRFMASYADIWLGSRIASWDDVTPLQVSAGKGDDDTTFTMALTAAQAQNLARAQYIVLEKTEDDLFRFVYSGHDVTLGADNVLTAAYDQTAIYVLDPDNGKPIDIAPIFEREHAEGAVLYHVHAALSYWDFTPGASVLDMQTISYQAVLDIETGTVENAGILTSHEDGMMPDVRPVNLADWYTVQFVSGERVKTYAEDGTLLPFFEWPVPRITGFELDAMKPVTFAALPALLHHKDLYGMMVVTDTQGNQYVSEPVLLHEALTQADDETLWAGYGELDIDYEARKRKDSSAQDGM